jgi:iron complex outermembrane recepter protein
MLCIPLLICGLLLADQTNADGELDLTALSLEDLMEIQVSLAVRSEGRLFDTPAAAYVLTGEDIRRSGANSLPEALRLVPGVEVARIDANKWAVATRGFNGRFANKLLVLIDGRAVYTPFYSGVMWEIRDVLLEDVERIEVIRGPGGTLWGANAVNGIINIVTKSAQETMGGLVRVGGGDEQQGIFRFRYGGTVTGDTHFRAFGKAFVHDAFVDSTGRTGKDDWRMGRVGFHLDRSLGKGGALTWQGDIYRGERGQIHRLPTLFPPYVDLGEYEARLAGGYLLGRWVHVSRADSELRFQVYYDRTEWDEHLIAETRDTYDLDFQHAFDWGRWQEVVWGLGYRLSMDDTSYRLSMDAADGAPYFSLDPVQRSSPLYSAFAQDKILLPGRVQLFVGTKLEHNDYTGFEYQPSARLLWVPRPGQAVWAAFTRAVRTPSRTEDDARLLTRVLPPGEYVPDSPPILVVIVGDRRVEAERLRSFELGYRLHPRPGLSFDLTGYYNRYADLQIGVLAPPVRYEEPVPYLELPLSSANGMKGETYGFELAIDWQERSAGWQLRAAYSYLHMALRAGPGATPVATYEEEASPTHQFFLWPSLELPRQLQLDATLRFVDRLPTYAIDRYTELDLHLSWRPESRLEFSVAAQDLLHDSHAEFSDIYVNTVPTWTQRGFYGTVTWTF